MRFFIIFFLFVFSFSCNTSNYHQAYKDYYKNQQLYIKSLLENDKKTQIKVLKELIKCGKYLNLDIKKYKNKLEKLEAKQTNYINILSYHPLKIKRVSQYKIFDIKHKNNYKKVIDLKYAISAKPYIKKIITKNITLKIAQFNKNTVRIVYSSNKPIKINIKKYKDILTIYPITKTISKYKITPLFPTKKVIVIDPGHGGKDSGGIGIGNRMEKVAVLQIAKKLKKYLQRYGYIVYLTRSGDYFRKLKWRTHFANQKKADLFISIHCNIAPKHLKSPHGIETYFLSPSRNERAIRVARLENKEIKGLNYLDQRVILNFLNRDRIISSNKLAIDVQSSILSSLKSKFKNVKDGGVRPAPFWVLVGTQMPAILIETGYLTNPIEAKRLFNPTYQNFLAKGIAKGVNNYFKKNP